MNLSVEALKQTILCPILLKNNISIEPKDQMQTVSEDLIHQIVCWKARRGGPITWEVLSALITRATRNMDIMEGQKVYANLEAFYDTLYQNLLNPMGKLKLDIAFEEVSIFGEIPIIDQREKPEFIFFEDLPNRSLLSKLVKVRLVSVWADKVLDKPILIKNMNLKSDDKSVTSFVPTKAYIENCRRVLESMIKSVLKDACYPPEEVCRICPNLTTCPV